MASDAPFPLGPISGAQLLGLVMCWTFWGVSCMQTFMYFINYKKDPMWIKLMVIWVWTLDTSHQVLILVGVYDALIINFGNVEHIITVVPKVFVWELLPQTFVAITVQGFFVYRIYKFSKGSWTFPVLFVPAALFQLGASFAFIAFCIRPDAVVELASPAMRNLSISLLAVACGLDIAIAVVLTYLLIQRRMDVEFQESLRMIQRLALFSVNTGTWTALFAFCSILMFTIFPSALTYVVFDFTICPLYVNTLLANLNARQYIRQAEIRDTRPSSGDNSTRGTIEVPLGRLGKTKTPNVIVTSETLKIDDRSNHNSSGTNTAITLHSAIKYFDSRA